MKLIDNRQSTLAHTFHMKAIIDTREQFERAMSIAFNDETAHFVAATRHFGLIFLKTIESEKENMALVEPIEFDVEPLDMGRKKVQTEWYSIQKLIFPGMSTGPAIEYAMNWLEGLSEAQFQYIAGYKHENWDLSTFSGVKIVTGYDLFGHIGMHCSAICHVKPTWLVSNRNF